MVNHVVANFYGKSKFEKNKKQKKHAILKSENTVDCIFSYN